MRIGIINYHRSYNYGAFVQCYSLKEKIKKDFPTCQVEVIDYINENVRRSYLTAPQRYSDVESSRAVEVRNAAFERSYDMLDLSPESFVDNCSESVIEYMNSRYDIVVVGSDAVWNWNSRGLPNAYFLNGYKGHKMSYAASAHLLDFSKVTKEEKEFLRKSWSEFEYIGVRDVVTDNFVKDILPEAKCFHNCDPTMFLDVENLPVDINKINENLIKCGVNIEKPLVGLMAEPRNLGKEINRHYNKEQIVSLYEPNFYGTFISNLTPLEWAKIFSLFNVTFTHFFHGTMLSLVNEVPCIDVECESDYSKCYTTKIEDLLNRLDLKEWYFKTNYNKIIRGLKKFGAFYDLNMWHKIFALSDGFIDDNQNYKSIIRNALNKEIESYLTFRDNLDRIVNSK